MNEKKEHVKPINYRWDKLNKIDQEKCFTFHNNEFKQAFFYDDPSYELEESLMYLYKMGDFPTIQMYDKSEKIECRIFNNNYNSTHTHIALIDSGYLTIDVVFIENAIDFFDFLEYMGRKVKLLNDIT